MSLLMKTLTHLHIQSFLPKPGFEPTRTYAAPLYGPTRYVQRHHNASGHTVYIGWWSQPIQIKSNDFMYILSIHI